MDSTIIINQIVDEIEKLDYDAKINIMSRIVKLLKREKRTYPAYSITKLKGLGKNIWHKTDISSYVATERESWD
jgi:ribosomal protein L18E